jgi:methionyl-tRNA synthetase
MEAGMDVSEYCDMMHERQKDIYRRFGLSFDHFGRSSSKENAELTKHIYLKLERERLHRGTDHPSDLLPR